MKVVKLGQREFLHTEKYDLLVPVDIIKSISFESNDIGKFVKIELPDNTLFVLERENPKEYNQFKQYFFGGI